MQHFVDPAAAFAARDVVERSEKFKVLAGGKAREKRSLRGDGNADLLTHAATLALRVECRHMDGSGIGQQRG